MLETASQVSVWRVFEANSAGVNDFVLIKVSGDKATLVLTEGYFVVPSCAFDVAPRADSWFYSTCNVRNAMSTLDVVDLKSTVVISMMIRGVLITRDSFDRLH